jgi:excisionase family DNA binding protein
MSPLPTPTPTSGVSADDAPEVAPIEPLTVRLAVAVRLTGISRSKLYELIAAGQIETVKVGRSTLVLYRSLKRLTGL